MARRFQEQIEMRETETGFNGFASETRFFKVSRETYTWLKEHHGAFTALSICDDNTISVAAEVDPDTGWNGWHWLHDELAMSGMNPEVFGI